MNSWYRERAWSEIVNAPDLQRVTRGRVSERVGVGFRGTESAALITQFRLPSIWE
jgi:hypothetical protein